MSEKCRRRLKGANGLPIRRSMERRAAPIVADSERGFTLVELLIALMVLAIVMVALAPAFYGNLRAASATNYRSTATGLAVAAIEQMRGFPYYSVGYSSSANDPAWHRW